MAIPESQLSRWSDHGAQDTAKRTHEAIRRVLNAHQWPPGMKYDFYLQGSYRNDTNIRGDSDVDIVLEMTSTVEVDTGLLAPYSAQQVRSMYEDSLYEWDDFRRLALNVLVAHYGDKIVGQGDKSIKIKADNGRVAADVVVCMGHRRYTSQSQYVQGMTFYALQEKRWIVNYPKLHYDNGANKSRLTSDRYKRTVRMFKNARNRLVSDGMISEDPAPSYFLECLVYNAPDSTFKASFQDTYSDIVNWMAQTNFSQLKCQNGQQLLFGSLSEQWSEHDAKALVSGLVNLWNNWD